MTHSLTHLWVISPGLPEPAGRCWRWSRCLSLGRLWRFRSSDWPESAAELRPASDTRCAGEELNSQSQRRSRSPKFSVLRFCILSCVKHLRSHAGPALRSLSCVSDSSGEQNHDPDTSPPQNKHTFKSKNTRTHTHPPNLETFLKIMHY